MHAIVVRWRFCANCACVAYSHIQLLWSVCERFQLKAFVAARLPYDCRPCSSNARLKAKNNFDAVAAAAAVLPLHHVLGPAPHSICLSLHTLSAFVCLYQCVRACACVLSSSSTYANNFATLTVFPFVLAYRPNFCLCCVSVPCAVHSFSRKKGRRNKQQEKN